MTGNLLHLMARQFILVARLVARHSVWEAASFMTNEHDDYYGEEPAEEHRNEDRPQYFEDHPNSGLGIASFVISLVAGLIAFGLIVAAAVIAAGNPNGVDEKSPVAIALGCSVIMVSFCILVGLCLGIAGLVQRNRKKLFAVLGTCFNGLLLLGLLGLVILGIALG
jgi:hypothetical protein